MGKTPAINKFRPNAMIIKLFKELYLIVANILILIY